jgi:hypothetical protein
MMQWISNNWRWLGPVAGGLGSIALAAGILWILPLADERPTNDIIADWNRTISRLGIEPVFPPEEDIYVGDIIAVVTEDHLGDTPLRADGKKATPTLSADNPLLNRAVKIDHYDMSSILKEFYEQLPVFSTSTTRPATDREIWDQKSDSAAFVPAEHKTLALAAFPAFTIKTSNTGSGDLSIPLIGKLRFSRGQSDSEELEIAFAETYGIPTVIAAAILDRYCQDPFSQAACVEGNVRKHLSFVMGDDVTALLPGTNRYRLEIQLHLVYRAYLTRAINRRLVANVTREAASEREAPAGSTPAELAAMATRKFQSDRESTLDRAFQRPIVFGYRAVKKSFPGTEEKPK